MYGFVLKFHMVLALLDFVGIGILLIVDVILGIVLCLEIAILFQSNKHYNTTIFLICGGLIRGVP